MGTQRCEQRAEVKSGTMLSLVGFMVVVSFHPVDRTRAESVLTISRFLRRDAGLRERVATTKKAAGDGPDFEPPPASPAAASAAACDQAVGFAGAAAAAGAVAAGAGNAG